MAICRRVKQQPTYDSALCWLKEKVTQLYKTAKAYSSLNWNLGDKKIGWIQVRYLPRKLVSLLFCRNRRVNHGRFISIKRKKQMKNKYNV